MNPPQTPILGATQIVEISQLLAAEWAQALGGTAARVYRKPDGELFVVLWVRGTAGAWFQYLVAWEGRSIRHLCVQVDTLVRQGWRSAYHALQ